MEKYSKHLESIVAERTQDLLQEKQKTDRLLYSKSGQSCGGKFYAKLWAISITAMRLLPSSGEMESLHQRLAYIARGLYSVGENYPQTEINK